MLESLLAALLIFVLRCVDVSLGTIRLILTVQGRRGLSSIIGFAEVTIFISAVASVVSGPLDPLRVIAYGAGFAAGTWVGVTLDRRLGLGDVMVRAISPLFAEIVPALTDAGFGVTLVEARGGRGSQVGVVFTVTHRRRLDELMRMIQELDEDAIISVQEVRQQHHGYFSPKRPGLTSMGPLERAR
jgi:uncharacterized protein YebE (UPF0316 family)